MENILKKIIDLICVISISNSFFSIVFLTVDGLRHKGIVSLRSFFGFAPWPMEWFIINIPLVLFGFIWILIRYSDVIYAKYQFLFGRVTFCLLGIALLGLVLARIFLRR